MTDATPAQPQPEQPQPLVSGPLSMKLLAVQGEPGNAQFEHTRFEDAPLGYALVVLRHGDRVLMVHERERACWELPGGGIEDGESPREAAVRELREETGQHIEGDALHFAGFTKTALGESQRVLYGAVYTARTQDPAPFAPNDEISAIHWRAGDEPLPGEGPVQTVDEYLVALFQE